MHLACICLRVKGSLPGSSACTPVFSESLQWCLTSQQHPRSAQCLLLVRAPCTFRDSWVTQNWPVLCFQISPLFELLSSI